MDLQLERIVHSYDTETRRIRCGRPSQIDSTKHASEVTCDACLVLLGRRSRAGSHVVSAPENYVH